MREIQQRKEIKRIYPYFTHIFSHLFPPSELYIKSAPLLSSFFCFQEHFQKQHRKGDERGNKKKSNLSIATFTQNRAKGSERERLLVAEGDKEKCAVTVSYLNSKLPSRAKSDSSMGYRKETGVPLNQEKKGVARRWRRLVTSSDLLRRGVYHHCDYSRLDGLEPRDARVGYGDRQGRHARIQTMLIGLWQRKKTGEVSRRRWGALNSELEANTQA